MGTSFPVNAGPTWDNPDTVVPIEAGRYIIPLLLTALHFFVRHRAKIVPHLTQDLIDALDLLATAEPFLQALNRYGPP